MAIGTTGIVMTMAGTAITAAMMAGAAVIVADTTTITAGATIIAAASMETTTEIVESGAHQGRVPPSRALTGS